jgi:predicted esterase
MVAIVTVEAPPAHADETSPASAAATAMPTPASQAWCAPDLETLAGDVCHVDVAPKDGRRTLVIFLHGVIQPDSGWQWQQQRGIARAAKRLGFSAIMPRGRRGIGPPKMTDWWTWPTSHVAQEQVEAELIEEWGRARATLEARAGKPFDEVFVFGFSNGAYYATSLAVRGRSFADGYAAFAGGAGPKHIRNAAKRAPAASRKPFFLAIAGKDKTTVRGAKQLAELLRSTRWPHKSESLPVGHAVADAHLKHALDFLRASTSKKP